MTKSRTFIATLAIATLTLCLALAATRADFIDRFNTGQVTDSTSIKDFWSVNNYSGADIGSSITEEPGGPLRLSYTGDSSGKAGPRLSSRVDPQFDFFAHPVSLTITASPTSTLTPIKPDSLTQSEDRAWTFLGLTATSGPGLTDGPNRVLLQLSNRNVLKFTIKDSENKILYTLGIFNIPPDAKVKKMTLYLDGSDETNGNFYINFGVQYADANGAITNYIRFDAPFDLGPDNGQGANKTQAQLDAVKAGFPHGAAAVIELLNVAQ